MIVTVPVQVEIPDGYEFVRYGKPYRGELYTSGPNICIGDSETSLSPRAIIRKIVTPMK